MNTNITDMEERIYFVMKTIINRQKQLRNSSEEIIQEENSKSDDQRELTDDMIGINWVSSPHTSIYTSTVGSSIPSYVHV